MDVMNGSTACWRKWVLSVLEKCLTVYGGLTVGLASSGFWCQVERSLFTQVYIQIIPKIEDLFWIEATGIYKVYRLVFVKITQG